MLYKYSLILCVPFSRPSHVRLSSGLKVEWCFYLSLNKLLLFFVPLALLLLKMRLSKLYLKKKKIRRQSFRLVNPRCLCLHYHRCRLCILAVASSCSFSYCFRSIVSLRILNRLHHKTHSTKEQRRTWVQNSPFLCLSTLKNKDTGARTRFLRKRSNRFSFYYLLHPS